jgi:rhomboid family GlyGly-CTERM serine protease
VKLHIAIALAVVTGLLALMPDGVGSMLAFERHEIMAGQVWRLWTAHLIHYSSWHAFADIAVLGLVAAMAERLFGARLIVIAMLLGAPMISLGLLALVPEMTHYEGSSALSYLFGTWCSVFLWRFSPKLHSTIAVVTGAAVAKLVIDAFGLLSALSSLPDGVKVAWQAHLLGVVLACAWMAFVRRSGQYRPSTA